MKRAEAAECFQAMQERLVAALAALDPTAAVTRDRWKRPDPKAPDGGGGLSIVLAGGSILEKAGVNFSDVHGFLTPEMNKALLGSGESAEFSAAGTSIVIHPRNPMIPTVHANVRYFEAAGRAWFGGGTDITPYYLFPEDLRDFHCGLKTICDRHDPQSYVRYKKWCDEYFFLPHRGEARGAGGIFFDYLGRDGESRAESYWPFVRDVASGFQDLYLPIAERRRSEPFGERERRFQLLRRGRYVEFNLLYDRGTSFGLKSGGRTESILMSLPPEVRWEYCFEPEPGTREGDLLELLRAPREWA